MLEKSKMFEKLKLTDPNQYAIDTAKAIQRLELIVSKKDNLINVFRFDDEESGKDIELTILRAFLNCMLN